MPDNSFDIVSKIELPEVNNAIQQALKEITTRYDLKDSKSTVELKEKDGKILLASADDFKLKAVIDILQSKLVKRNVPIKGLQFGTLIQGSGGSVRQEITLQQGIPMEKAAVCMNETGNTSSASIPLALFGPGRGVERITQGDLVLLVGFGAGMTAASAILEWGGK